MRKEEIEIILAAVGLGGPFPDAARGPEALVNAGMEERFKKLGLKAYRGPLLKIEGKDPTPGHSNCRYLESLLPFLKSLYAATTKALDQQRLPLILGGDHSLSIGSTKAAIDFVRRKCGKDAKIGLLWVDAHPDVNTPLTTQSGNIHGMSVAALLGEGQAELCSIGDANSHLSPDMIAYIGLRDVDPPEKKFIRDRNILAFTMKEVDLLGIGEVCRQALKKMEQADAFVLSFDLDVIDPRFAPAVATPVRGGLSFRESHLVMELVAASQKLCAIEVVEFNPALDQSQSTLTVALDLIESALGKSIL